MPDMNFDIVRDPDGLLDTNNPFGRLSTDPAAPDQVQINEAATVITSTSVYIEGFEADRAETYNAYLDGTKVASGLEAPAYTFTDLTPESSYNNPGFQLSAENSNGEGPLSAAVTATTPAVPEGLTAQGVDGVFAEGETITISSDGSSNFGNDAVTLRAFDTMPSGEGVITSAASHSGNTLLRAVNQTSDTNRRLHLFPDTKQLMVSYFTQIPDGYGYPGHVPGTGTLKDGAPVSNWKIAWAFYNQDGHSAASGKADICLPTSGNPNQCRISGNTNISGSPWWQHGSLTSVFPFGSWCWFVALVDGVSNRVRVRSISNLGYRADDWQRDTSDSFWGGISSEYRFFDRVNFPGWVSSQQVSWEDCVIYHDDMVIQTGPGAGRLAFIGNASTFENCTDAMPCELVSAGNTSMTVKVRQGPFTDLTGKYLFVLGPDLNPVPYNGQQGRLISGD
jgi:hypothetical protein